MVMCTVAQGWTCARSSSLRLPSWCGLLPRQHTSAKAISVEEMLFCVHMLRWKGLPRCCTPRVPASV